MEPPGECASGSFLCEVCDTYSQFTTTKSNVEGREYSILKCSTRNCRGKLFQCDLCQKSYTHNKGNHRFIKAHMKTHQNQSLPLPNESLDNNNTPTGNQELDDPLRMFEPSQGGVDPPSQEDEVSTEVQNAGEFSCSGSLTEMDIDNRAAYEFESNTIADPQYPNFGTESSDNYFGQDFKMYHKHREVGGGFRGICYRARKNTPLNEVKHISSIQDSKFMYHMTKLIKSTSGGTIFLLYQIFSEIMKRGNVSFMNSNIVVPTHKNEAERVFNHGKYGIFENLPCPPVYDVGGHACMKVEDVIAHHLALGRGLSFSQSPSLDNNSNPIRNTYRIHGSEAMTKLLEIMRDLDPNHALYFYGYLTTWSDAFLNNFVKQKLNNVWLYTITLPDVRHNATSPFHTYCVAVGSGYLNHTPVLDWYSEGLEPLMKGRVYYCSFRRQFIQAKFGVVAALADRPEKSFILKTALLGTFGRIASWATEIYADSLADCPKCFERRLMAILKDRHNPGELPECQNCMQFDLKSKSPAVKKLQLPEKYPTKQHEESPCPPFGRGVLETHIRPMEQNFKWLIAAMVFATWNVSTGVWNKSTMTAYLRTCAVAKSVRENVWVRNKPGATQNEDDEEDESVEDSDEEECGELDGFTPTYHQLSTAPLLWYGNMSVDAFVDCGMHLVFHGIVKYTVERMGDFTTDHGLEQKFHRIINIHLYEIQSLNLEWMKVKPLPNTNWLAENELGFARIIPFIYGSFFLNLELPKRKHTTEQTEHAIMQMFHSLHVMICILMTERKLDSRELNFHIKLFLSCCHRYCRSYWEESVVPFWAKTGNFPTLLCLAKQHKIHGPLRWYWEGTSERFIQQLKRHLKSMRRNQSYFAGKLRSMFRMNVLDGLMEDLFQDENEDQPCRRLKMYHHYDMEIDELRDKFGKGDVMSCFTMAVRGIAKLYIAYGRHRRGNKVNIIGVSRLDRGCATMVLGFAYVKCEMKANEYVAKDLPLQEMEQQMISYALLLPLEKHKIYQKKRAIVYHDWDVGDKVFEKRLPNICKECFKVKVINH